MRLLLAFATALLAASPLAAQFTVAAGVALPVGDFGRIRPGTNDGFATPGFVSLVHLDAPFAVEGTQGLSFTGSFGLLYFPSDAEAFSPFPESQQPDPALGAEVTRDPWIAVPVMAGFRYEWAGTRDVSVIGALQGGVGIARAPGFAYVLTESPEPYRLEQTSGIAATFVASTGVALALFDRLELGVRGIWFGSPTFTVDKTTTADTQPETSEVEIERPIGATTFTLGYRF